MDIFSKLAGFVLFFIIEMLEFWTQRWVITCMGLEFDNRSYNVTIYFQDMPVRRPLSDRRGSNLVRHVSRALDYISGARTIIFTVVLQVGGSGD
jgi:hypothetical protein